MVSLDLAETEWRWVKLPTVSSTGTASESTKYDTYTIIVQYVFAQKYSEVTSLKFGPGSGVVHQIPEFPLTHSKSELILQVLSLRTLTESEG